jgi:hypothetical protein
LNLIVLFIYCDESSSRLAINSIPSISSSRGVALTAYSALARGVEPLHLQIELMALN